MRKKHTAPAVFTGHADFSRVSKSAYYVDKTHFIFELLGCPRAQGELETGKTVSLFARPRRFGKSTLLSMLEHFFSIQHRDKSAALFDDLAIAKEKALCQQWQGQCPVIRITLSEVKASSYQEFIAEMRTLVSHMYNQHNYLLGSAVLQHRYHLREIPQIERALRKEADEFELRDALKHLSECLYQHHTYDCIEGELVAKDSKKVIILIDEYDAPFQKAYVKQFESKTTLDAQAQAKQQALAAEEFEKIRDFLAQFLSRALKDNIYLERAVICGILRVSQVSLFSLMNNVSYYSPLSKHYADCFGFTEEEVKKLLSIRGVQAVEKKMVEMRAWYNGYTFGSTTIYNPWSVIEYIEDLEPAAYWSHTGNSTFLDTLFKQADSGIKQGLQQLIQGEAITCEISEEATFGNVHLTAAFFWGVLLTSGYITVRAVLSSEDVITTCKVAIPNHEVYLVFKKIIRDWFSHMLPQLSGGTSLELFYQALIKPDLQAFEQSMRSYIEESVSFFNLGKKTPENVYHVFVLGMLIGLKDSHNITAEPESGYGRPDILLIPKKPEAYSNQGIVIELKSTSDEKLLDQELNVAMAQIKNLGYISAMRKANLATACCIGISFFGKRMKMAFEVIKL